MRDHQAEQKKVERVRYLLDRLDGDQWVVETDNDLVHLVAFRRMDEATIIATFSKEALSHEIELIALGLDVARLLLDVGERASRIISALRRALGHEERKPREKNYAANAAILCAEPLFHRYLERRDPTRTIHNKDHADTTLKKLIGISSKKQLNTEARAQTAFRDLRADYQAWKERGRA